MTIGTEKKKIEKFVDDRFFLKKWLNVHGALAKNKNKHCAESIHEDANSDSFLSSPRCLGWERPHSQTSTSTQHTNTIRDHRVFVGTWNVAGICPGGDVNLENWLDLREPADVYVLGFQEIVPLNTGNVLYAKDDGASAWWEALIGRTLNKESNDYSTNSFKQCALQEQGVRAKCPYRAKAPAAVEKSLACNNFPRITDSNLSSFDSDQRMNRSWSVLHHNSVVAPDFIHSPSQHCHFEGQMETNEIRDSYVHIASKQMVGLYMTIWIRRNLRKAVGNLKVSCASLGLMGFLGNKGAISISMSLHQTSFCFIRSHLTSGEKEEDRLRRNADVGKILRKTYFPSRAYHSGGRYSPQSIFAHLDQHQNDKSQLERF